MKRGQAAAARLLFAASALAVASVSLLPGAVVLLLLLLDRTAHAVLGLSGAFLLIAGSVVPRGDGGGALPGYVPLQLGASGTVVLSLCRALPALFGLVLAARAPTRLVRVLSATDAALIAAMSFPSRVLLLAALPGVLATVALLAAPPPPRRGASQIT